MSLAALYDRSRQNRLFRRERIARSSGRRGNDRRDHRHGLRLSVVAEGVETAGKALFLRQRGCDEVQGDLFGQPSPPEDFKDRMRARPVLIEAESKDDSWDL